MNIINQLREIQDRINKFEDEVNKLDDDFKFYNIIMPPFARNTIVILRHDPGNTLLGVLELNLFGDVEIKRLSQSIENEINKLRISSNNAQLAEITSIKKIFGI